MINPLIEDVSLHLPVLSIDGVELDIYKIYSHVVLRSEGNIYEELIERAFIRTQASKLGIEATTDELQEAADAYRKRAGMLSSIATQGWFDNHFITETHWVEYIEDQVLRKKLKSYLFSIDTVSSWFASHRPQYDAAEISHCVTETKEEAREIVLQIEEGKHDFHYFARRFSQDKETAVLGGYLGWLRRGQITPAQVEVAVFGSQPGQTAGPFRFNRRGSQRWSQRWSRRWRLIHVINIKRGELTQELIEEIREEIFKRWLTTELQFVNVRRLLQTSRSSPV
jgi:PPIC-type PPIASE domain